MKNELRNHNPEWHKANQDYLMNALAKVRTALGQTESSNENFTSESSSNNALSTLCHIFALSDFERDILLLCLGMEIDANWGVLCSNAPGNHPKLPYPTFSLAMAVLPTVYWQAFTPSAPLRKWEMIHIGEGQALNLSPLRIDERILHYLMGFDHLDEKLQGFVEPLTETNETQVASHRQLAEQLATTWAQTVGTRLPIIQLCGDEVGSKRAIASTACGLLNVNLHLMSAKAITNFRNHEINELLRLWSRESMLTNSALLLDCDEIDITDPAKDAVIGRLIENISNPLIITTGERRRSLQSPLIAIEVHKPSTTEQRIIWQNALKEAAPSLNGHVDTLVSHFSLNAATIHTVCTEAKGKSQETFPCTDAMNRVSIHSSLSTLLWDTCRSQARPRLDELAQPIEAGSTWDDLVLPELQRQVLRDIAAHVRQRAKVYEQWGFGNKGGRGLGISALFAGASGTGKTMAAEVIADELRLDLYRIDLSQVVSKYIGETEKNLRRVFDAAETGGAILLFDEADALFGKRSEVKDSHDRHANIEVGYLLQRMESYRGLAILTTNLKGSLDQAFLRRIRFVVQFPFPDASQRAEIWQRIFPRQTPTQDLDPSKLAKLNVSGGNIRNIALNAAFLAADAGEPVEMKHILQSAKSEYAKLERPLTDTEVKGWV
ncbi:ATP-binding protein [Anabaena sp. CCY 0017]|uniref:ATP-binding protein n=1 Tax=Anabaena sp. CCY 0017 TaxID=3103866 RepID=UPI0039C5C5DD